MTSSELYIPIVLGTARPDRKSEFIANFVLAEAKKYGFKSELVDIRNKKLTPSTTVSDETEDWKNFINQTDGLIVVAPEYNHGYPGELKLLIDLAYKEYNRKPIGICGVSTGPLGGARMVEQLRLIAIELQMVPIRNAVYFGLVNDLIDDNGLIKESEIWTKKLTTVFDEIKWYGEALKIARNK